MNVNIYTVFCLFVCFRHSTFLNSYNFISCAVFCALKMGVSPETFAKIYFLQ